MLTGIMAWLFGPLFGARDFWYLCIVIADMCAIFFHVAGRKKRSGQRKWAKIIWTVSGVAARIFAFWLVTG